MAISPFISATASAIFDSILSLQVISHIPMFRVNLPAQEMGFMTFLNEISSFNVGDPTTNTNFTDSRAFSDEFEWLKYDTSNFFQNLGFIAVIMVVILFFQFVLIPFILYLQRYRQCRCIKKTNKATNGRGVCSNIWLRFFMLAYFEMLIACFIGI